METILTSFQIPKDLNKHIHTLAKKKGCSKTSLFQEAIKQYLMRQEIETITDKMQGKARLMGIDSDDDVVALIHQIRKTKK